MRIYEPGKTYEGGLQVKRLTIRTDAQEQTDTLVGIIGALLLIVLPVLISIVGLITIFILCLLG